MDKKKILIIAIYLITYTFSVVLVIGNISENGHQNVININQNSINISEKASSAVSCNKELITDMCKKVVYC